MFSISCLPRHQCLFKCWLSSNWGLKKKALSLSFFNQTHRCTCKLDTTDIFIWKHLSIGWHWERTQQLFQRVQTFCVTCNKRGGGTSVGTMWETEMYCSWLAFAAECNFFLKVANVSLFEIFQLYSNLLFEFLNNIETELKAKTWFDQSTIKPPNTLQTGFHTAPHCATSDSKQTNNTMHHLY